MIRCQSTSTVPPPASGLLESTLHASSFAPTSSSSATPPSAKLAALHARLSLSPKFPLSTLALALRDESAYACPLNNSSLAQLGNSLMSYHLSEHLIAHYPRLPMPVLFAAMFAYVGPPSLTALVHEWGVEPAAAPGPEVDAGLLQLERVQSGAAPNPLLVDRRPNAKRNWRKGISSRIVYDDEFGDVPSLSPSLGNSGTTLERASTNFARAVLGAIYLHSGRQAAKQFVGSHILSRHVALAGLFAFTQPTRDLSRLCAREGFDGPIARLMSETGRRSRHPVFVVGVYSGRDKLGEGSGASLDEARNRAAVNALLAWYLYRPSNVRVPSDAEGGASEGRARAGAGGDWRPLMIDGGEVVV
ncbi:MAG: hypothetical protein M1838_002626 [Thelocarpon superellum]|nr:MAG: hypothetical protein M1838_002626 [Thelocarpon superellum]